MARRSKRSAVHVRLRCVYSGDGMSWNAGSTVQVDAEEANRLVALGVGTVVDAPEEAAPDNGTAADGAVEAS